MAVRQGWVFRCDEPDCTEQVIGYMDSRKKAIDAAREYGWKCVLYANAYDCYCPIHAKGRDEHGRRIVETTK